jgi:hypothetical protein
MSEPNSTSLGFSPTKALDAISDIFARTKSLSGYIKEILC